MNRNIQLGLINILQINRFTENGAYLKANDEEEVLLPKTYLSEDMEIGDEIEVFIYTDSEDRLVATTIYPKAVLNDFAVLEIVDVNKIGAFANMGLPKDLLIPFAKQRTKYLIGDLKVLRVIKDDHTNRLIGTEKLNKYFETQTQALRKNQKVDILVWMETELGYKVIVDNKYEGLIFKNEVFETINIGDKKSGYIKNKRPDGKLDIALQVLGKANVQNQASSKIIDMLNKNNNFLPYNYKSAPDIISNVFGLSKKNFKATLTKLINENKIKVEDDGIYLVS